MSQRAVAILCALGALASMPMLAVGVVAAQPDTEPRQSQWSVRLSAGAGIGTRSVDIPTSGVSLRTRTGVFPALAVGFMLERAFSDALSTGLVVRYQTSVGHRINELHTDGSSHAMDLRSHRLELSLGPKYALDTRHSWVLGSYVGYGIRNLRPETAHLNTPGYSLDGPTLRLLLQLPLWTERLSLRVGPEAQWIVHVGSALVARGVDDSGLSLAGEAALALTLVEELSLQLTYREARCTLGSSGPGSFTDIERSATLRLEGQL